MSNPQKKMKKMKKFLLSLGLVAMMLNLTNCAQYEDVNTSVDVKGDFELYASISRTANDGLNTVWSANDALNVFHAVTDMTTYTNDGQFKLESGSADRFLGNLAATLDVEEEYDWYAFYPYSSYITTPANNSAGYTYIGSRSDAKQTQNGNNSMAHIAGSNYPMAGYAKAVGAASSPTVVFNHIASLVEFEVVNKLSEAITVNEIAFTAEEDIVGAYYVNFADFNNLQFTKYNNYQSNTATLTVSNGTAIEAGASAKFYLAVKPFTAEAGSELTIKISATSANGIGSHEQDLTLKADAVFAPGKIKPVKVNYTTVIETQEAETWKLITSVEELTDGTYVIVTKQKNGTTIAYCPSTATSSGPTQKVTTLFDLTTKTFQSNAVPADARWNFTGDFEKMTIKNADGKYLYTINDNNGVRVGTTADSWVFTKSAKNANAWYLQNTLNSRYLTLYGTTNWRSYQSPFEYSASADQNSECHIYKLYDPNAPATPFVSVKPALIENVASEGATAKIEYTVYNAVEGVNVTATTTADWITIASDTNAFNLTIAANEGTEDRQAEVVIAYEGAKSKSVVVKQAASSAGGGEDIILMFKKADYTKSVSAYTETWEHTYAGYKYSIVNFNNNQKGWDYIKCGRKNNTSVASINTTFAIPWAVSNVTVTVDAVTTSKVNKTYLVVATDAKFSNIVETVNVTIAKGDVVYKISNPGADYYYKVVYDCASGSSNGFVTVSKVVYTAQ